MFARLGLRSRRYWEKEITKALRRNCWRCNPLRANTVRPYSFAFLKLKTSTLLYCLKAIFTARPIRQTTPILPVSDRQNDPSTEGKLTTLRNPHSPSERSRRSAIPRRFAIPSTFGAKQTATSQSTPAPLILQRRLHKTPKNRMRLHRS